MKKMLILYTLGIAVCTLTALNAFAKKPKTIQTTPLPAVEQATPVTKELAAPVAKEPAAPGFDLKKSKAWIVGRVALDSGYAKSVTFFPPSLSLDKRPDLALLNENDGTFAFEVDLLCPAVRALNYNGIFIPVYLEPNDTLHVEFAARDFQPNSDAKFTSIRYGGRNATLNADLMDFYLYRERQPYHSFRGAKTVGEYNKGTNELYDTYRSQLRAFTVGRKCDPRFFDLANQEITLAKAMYTWYTIDVTPMGLLSGKEAPALFAGSDSLLDDRNFIRMNDYMYYLDQLGQVSIWADTIAKTDAEKMQIIRGNFDTLLTRYPAGLSRDAILLISLQRHYKRKEKREALSDVYAATDRYLQSPVMREVWEEFRAPYLAAAAPKRNVHKLELRSAEQFIADLFAPYRNSGKVLYVDIWGVWCGACRAAMPSSLELHKKLEGQPVEFVYLCATSRKEDFDRDIVSLGIADAGKNILLSEDQSKILMHYFGFAGLPHYWIIDKNGDFVSESAPGPSDPKTYETLKKLAEK